MPPDSRGISTQALDGWTSTVDWTPFASCTRTSTSVMVPCRPTKAMRFPANPSGDSTRRRSTRESESSRTAGGDKVAHIGGQLQLYGQAHAGIRRRAPKNRIAARNDLVDFEIGWTRFMRLYDARRHHQAKPQPRTAAPPGSWAGRLWKDHLIFGPHRVERFALGFGSPGVQPRGLNLSRDRLHRKWAGGQATALRSGPDASQVPTSSDPASGQAAAGIGISKSPFRRRWRPRRECARHNNSGRETGRPMRRRWMRRTMSAAFSAAKACAAAAPACRPRASGEK